MLEYGYLSGTFPQLDIMTVNKLLRPFHSLIVVGANQWFKTYEMAATANNIRPIFRHAAAPICLAGALPNSQSPKSAEGGAVMR
jgi:hypothetical protein